MTPVGFGVIGLSARGRALVHGFAGVRDAEVRWLFDESPAPALRLAPTVPRAGCASRIEDILGDRTLDAVVICTPPATRGELTRRAIEAGKHVLVEPPLAPERQDADDLVALAADRGLELMTAGPLCFHPAVQRLKALIAERRLGELYYLYASRLDLTPARQDESVRWTAGAEALSLLLWTVDDEPVDVVARGGPCASAEAADVAFCHLRFASGLEAELRISSLEPRRTLQLTAVGSTGMAVFDELEGEHPLTIHHTIAHPDGCSSAGDTYAPRLPAAEPAQALCEAFLAAVASPGARANVGDGSLLVAILEALQRSLERGGSREIVGTTWRESAPGVIRLPLRSV